MTTQEFTEVQRELHLLTPIIIKDESGTRKGKYIGIYNELQKTFWFLNEEIKKQQKVNLEEVELIVAY